MEKTYKNRYGDIFTYTEDENQDILWQGNFEYCRIGFPNDYTKAYTAYIDDNCNSDHCMSLELFKKAVHEWDDESNTYHYPKYVNMIDNLKEEIDMVDPSGGPYMSRGMSLKSFGFKNYVVKDFKAIDIGYKIITEKL